MEYMNKKELSKKIKSLSSDQPWNHNFNLPFGLKTIENQIDSPANNINKLSKILKLFVPQEFKEKKILDIGCSDGYFSIELAKLNSNLVVGTDLDEIRIKRAKFIKEIFELKNVNFHSEPFEKIIQNDYKDIKFDIVIALGLLHRIPDPQTFLEKISCLSETLILEFKSYSSFFPILYYPFKSKKMKLNSLNKLHLIPSIKFVKKFLTDRGFRSFKVHKDHLSKLKFKRAIVIAKK